MKNIFISDVVDVDEGDPQGCVPASRCRSADGRLARVHNLNDVDWAFPVGVPCRDR